MLGTEVSANGKAETLIKIYEQHIFNIRNLIFKKEHPKFYSKIYIQDTKLIHKAIKTMIDVGHDQS